MEQAAWKCLGSADVKNCKGSTKQEQMGTVGKALVVKPSNCSAQMFGVIICSSLLFPVNSGVLERRHRGDMHKRKHRASCVISKQWLEQTAMNWTHLIALIWSTWGRATAGRLQRELRRRPSPVESQKSVTPYNCLFLLFSFWSEKVCVVQTGCVQSEVVTIGTVNPKVNSFIYLFGMDCT